jgi:hypothetical protein
MTWSLETNDTRNVRFSGTIKSGRKNRPIRFRYDFFPTYVTRRVQSLPLHSRAHLVAHVCDVAFIRADGPTDGLGNSTCRISRTARPYKRNSDCPTDGPLVCPRKLSDGPSDTSTDPLMDNRHINGPLDRPSDRPPT